MALERRRNGRLYYYRVRREGGRIVKDYIGGGEIGRQAAETDRAARRQAAQLRAEQNRPIGELVDLIDEFAITVDMVVESQLICAGWRKQNRTWRTNNGRRSKQKC